MTAPVQPAPPPADERKPLLGVHSSVAMATLRWAFIVATSVFAFHRTLFSLIDTTRHGGMNGYVWMVAFASLLAAAGLAIHNRTELPIHDRQTDIIVAIMGLVLALLLHGVLLQRYALYFDLLRLDLVAWWLFMLSASIALFGLRPVTRFGWAWLLLLAVFPLPYHIFVLVLGGSHVAAAMGTLLVAAAGTAIAVGRHWGRGLIGALSSWVAGLTVLVLMYVFFRGASLLAYQLIPAMTAIVVAASAMFLLTRRGRPIRVLYRKIEPLAAKQVWSAVPLVLVVAVALSFVRLPDSGVPEPARIAGTNPSTSLRAPAGWHVAATRTYPWVARIHGEGGELVRQEMVADHRDPRFDKFARPRAVVVDTITTPRPASLSLFPARMPYRVNGVRISTPRQVDLGHGISGTLLTAVDDEILITWDALEWTWTNGSVAQRIVIIAVDNHDDDAPFPQPTGGIVRTLNSMFTILFRGNTAATDTNPVIKDEVLLTEFGRALADAQLEDQRTER
ncbi:hypothetical protein FR943_07490 [Mycobacterium sp. TNTM28]|uniref:Uncharacterized protein n=1 Tax=[Mycobacterium] fortunisiensis TaxID=2600579 RepID=A0ABS6KJB5_9MYCO|nr:hypothetical protein [[Mycobacterium] fortunisiensis]MBU9763681.1 hypothetical protein [[Mycobacterium] fortunisiensis]